MKSHLPLVFVGLLAAACSSEAGSGAPPGAAAAGAAGSGLSAQVAGTGGSGGTGAVTLQPEGGAPPVNDMFGMGNYTGQDASDPCVGSQRWKVGSILTLSTGTLVRHEDKLWQLTGTTNVEGDQVYAQDVCTPPGQVEWCIDQYAWQEVGSCPP